MKKQFLFLCLMYLITINIHAQDIRGSEIKYSNTDNQTCNFEISLYVQSGMGIERDTMMFGNLIVPGTATQLSNNITLWKYSYQYAFGGNGMYQFYYPDSFRISSISNIQNSESEIILPLLTLILNPYIGSNSSPSFLKNQTEIYRSGNIIIHEPMAFDAEGDSLVFSLAPATSSNYTFPMGISINSQTGKVEIPYSSNIYAINIRVDEFRNGVRVSSTNREMLIDGNALTDISENVEHKEMEIFPNPVLNYAKIKFETSRYNSDYYIVDSSGRIIFKGNINDNEITIDLSGLSQGIYSIVCYGENTLYRRQFIKL